MAAEQDLTLGGGDSAEEIPSGGGKKKLIIIIVGALFLIGAAVGSTLFFLSGDDGEVTENVTEDVEDVEDVVEEESSMPAVYVILKPEFVVSFQVGTRQRFLQVNIEVMTRRQDVIDALTLHDPMIRNDIIRIIGEQDFEHLRTPDGRIELQNLLTAHLAQLVKQQSGVEGVESVLFTDFVMQ